MVRIKTIGAYGNKYDLVMTKHREQKDNCMERHAIIKELTRELYRYKESHYVWIEAFGEETDSEDEEAAIL